MITGAAKRIGAACIELLHDKGCNLFLHYKSSEKEALKLAQRLNAKRNNSVQIQQADLTNMSDLNALAIAAEQAWEGGIDVLINNASLFYPQAVEDVSEQSWNELFNSNLKAPFFLAQALTNTLSKNQGCIVNIIDIHAEHGLKNYPVYSMTKAGLASMTQVLAKELAPTIRVNGVSPGAICWPEKELSNDEKNEILQRIALKKSGQAEDIAKTVHFLIAEADYITGQIISVDGGRRLFC